jgi:hypothetical protein
MVTVDKLNAVLDLAKKDEAAFFMRVASDLTVRARGLYGLDSDKAVALYRAFNELMHLVINQSLNASRGQARYGLEEFIRIIAGNAEKQGIGHVLDDTFDVVLKRSTP